MASSAQGPASYARSREKRIGIDTQLRLAHTDALVVSYEQTGPDTGVPVVLLHGFPYDIRQYDDVRHLLASQNRRIIVPYQSYFNTRQGEIGLEADRNAFCHFLWRLWSPDWHFTDEQFAKTAASFANPDFVPTVIHSYRHRYANAPGDPELEHLEARLARSPAIGVPTIALHGAQDRVEPPTTIEGQERHFTGFYRKEVLAGVGHCVPAEAPGAVADALESLIARAKSH